MADFVQKFKLLIDADPRGAVDGLGKFSDAAVKSEKSTGLFGKAADKLGVSTGQMGTIVAGAAVVAGGAIAKFALDGAAKFESLGKSVETFSKVSGTSADTASRFIAVADDYGVSIDSLSTAVGKLGKGLGTNAGELDKFGVSVAHAKDGSVDLTATTLNVIDAYNNTVDPAQKAALASTAFGKSYQELIPLIDVGAAKIKSSFDSVDKAQVFDEKKVAEAKAYGVAVDNLKDKFYDFQLTAGEKLIPVLIGVADGMAKIAGPAATVLGGAFDGLVYGIQALATGLTLGLLGNFTTMNKELPTVTANVDDATAAMLLHGRYVREAAEGYGPLAGQAAIAAAALEEAIDPTTGLTKAQTDLASALKASAEGFKAAADGQKAQVSAMRAAADATFAVSDATDTYTKFEAGLAKSLKEAKGDQDEINALYREGTTDAAKIADGVVRLADEHAKATGATYSATQQQEAWNREMLYAASHAVPAQQDAIAQYIATANGIPKSKVTDILAHTDDSTFEQAATDLNNVSVARTATILADADTKSATADLKKAADGPYTATIRVVVPNNWQGPVPAGSVVVHSSNVPAPEGQSKGGPVEKGTSYLVGETGEEGFVDKSGAWVGAIGTNGPEMFTAPFDGTIIPNSQLAANLPKYSRAGGRPAAQSQATSSRSGHLHTGFLDLSAIDAAEPFTPRQPEAEWFGRPRRGSYNGLDETYTPGAAAAPAASPQIVYNLNFNNVPPTIDLGKFGGVVLEALNAHNQYSGAVGRFVGSITH